MQFDEIAKIEVFSWLISFIAVYLLAKQGWGAGAMAAGFLVRQILVTAGSFAATYRQYPIRLFHISDLRETVPLLRFGFFDLSSRWADFLANHLDKLIVGKWLGAASLGYYNLAFTFLMLPTARLGYVVARVSFPVFARVRHDAALLQDYFQKANRNALVMLFFFSGCWPGPW
ncbi:MAG: oligosaccharide flippase family protein [Lewinellaceae bacterium]|nr:oligosaccharide flippase family protein [Lewinellaceae bacterium]